MSFGFSVGDSLAVLKLVGAVIDGLQESSHISRTVRSLVNELLSLEVALQRVKRLDLDDDRTVDKIALQQTASQCQQTIDRFYKKLQKYQPYLLHTGANFRIKSAWSKVKWAVCKQDDLVTFRAEIRGHTSSIELLLLVTHMEATTVQGRTHDLQHTRVTNLLQDISRQTMNALNSVSTSVAQSAQQGKLLLESSIQIVQTNLRIFQMVHDIHRFIRTVPHHVHRQQPVILTDPFNKESPFHLEFVRSLEALLAVLKENLRETGCGPGMIDRGEFIIEEAGTELPIDLTQPWGACFAPGQNLIMSMIFEECYKGLKASCPRCHFEHAGLADMNLMCTQCGTVFRRGEELVAPPQTLTENDASDPRGRESFVDHSDSHAERPVQGSERPRKRKRCSDDEPSNMRKFRRIRLVHPRLPLDHVREERYRCRYTEIISRAELQDHWMGFCTIVKTKGRTWLYVISEDEPKVTILRERVSLATEDHFERYTDNAISWSSTRGTINILSFLHDGGCSRIWHEIIISQGQSDSAPVRSLLGLVTSTSLGRILLEVDMTTTQLEYPNSEPPKTSNENKRVFSCKRCGKNFTHKEQLWTHEQEVHNRSGFG